MQKLKNVVFAVSLMVFLACGYCNAQANPSHTNLGSIETTTNRIRVIQPLRDRTPEKKATGEIETSTYAIPGDEGNLYLTIAGAKGDARFRALVDSFVKHEGMQQLKDDTHFSVLATGTPMYEGRYKDQFTTLPCVRLQTADGQKLAEYAGDDIPSTEHLYPVLRQVYWNYHGRRCGPKGCPPKQQCAPDYKVVVVPDVVVNPARPNPTVPSTFPVWQVLLAVGAGILVAFVDVFSREWE